MIGLCHSVSVCYVWFCFQELSLSWQLVKNGLLNARCFACYWYWYLLWDPEEDCTAIYVFSFLFCHGAGSWLWRKYTLIAVPLQAWLEKVVKLISLHLLQSGQGEELKRVKGLKGHVWRDKLHKARIKSYANARCLLSMISTRDQKSPMLQQISLKNYFMTCRSQ